MSSRPQRRRRRLYRLSSRRVDVVAVLVGRSVGRRTSVVSDRRARIFGASDLARRRRAKIDLMAADRPTGRGAPASTPRARFSRRLIAKVHTLPQTPPTTSRVLATTTTTTATQCRRRRRRCFGVQTLCPTERERRRRWWWYS